MRPLTLVRLWLGWLALSAPLVLHAADRFPGEEWDVAESPDEAGWSSAALSEARSYAKTISTAAVVVVHQGRIVEQWGETERPFNCHSMRKSILSALYGIQVAEGTVDLDRTLEDLGIDDNEPSLTETERRATIRDLLKARSGIYHPALYETAAMKARRPPRGSHAPGEAWYYNNWDFNALGTIFETLTVRCLFEEFQDRLARPLQMQDFDRSAHTRYVSGSDSVHRAYPVQLSARDLARFGLLFARSGRWHDEQILSREWVNESTTSYSRAGDRGGYGYMWWVSHEGRHYPGLDVPEGTVSARGAGGHCILIVPEWDLVVVHRVNTFQRNNQVSADELGRLLNLIVAAMPEETGSARTDAPLGSSVAKLHQDSGEPPFDLLFKNGRVMDGTGNPWFKADVAVRRGRVVAVGRLDAADARRTIDLSGKVIAPGFIDVHSHADRGLTSSSPVRRSAPNLVMQGITTVVVNQDGFGPPSLQKQLETMLTPGVGPNVIQLIGHGAIRRAVMGDDHRRAASDEELQAMLKLLRDALQLGAFGMSAGLEYVPGRWSTSDEIKALVAELAREDHVYIAHERSSGADPMWYLPSRDGAGRDGSGRDGSGRDGSGRDGSGRDGSGRDGSGRDGAGSLTMIDNVAELIDVAESTGAKVVATHIKARGRNFWGASRLMIEMINEARERGVRIYADQYPYNTSGRATAASFCSRTGLGTV